MLDKSEIYEIIENIKIAKDAYKMILKGNTKAILFPGQFINIKIKDCYLRRPISVCDYDTETITIIYKVVGQGTDILSKMKKGETLDILVGLGNGFDIRKCEGNRPLIIGGGVGTPPMYRLCKDLIKKSKEPIVVLGFNSKEDVFFEEEFKKLGVKTYITTVDGSYGQKGFVTDVIKNLDYSYYYACGPQIMLKFLAADFKNGEVSLEAKMGCGFGACMGCSIETTNGPKRVCKEGPVFDAAEVKF